MRERLSGGRWVETAHAYSPGLGWVVTHEDVTEEIESSEIIQKRQLELEHQNLRLDAAVNNISQGLCMYDAKGRLVICNQPYQRIYNLPERLLKSGTLLDDILGHLFDEGMQAGANREDYIRWRREVISRGEYGKNIHELERPHHHDAAPSDEGWRLGHHARGHHRAAPAGRAHPPPRPPRRADRSCPTACSSSKKWRPPNPACCAASASPCSASTSTTSSPSTIRSATRSATSCCSRSRPACGAPPARTMCWPASAATSSRCCCAAIENPAEAAPIAERIVKATWPTPSPSTATSS